MQRFYDLEDDIDRASDNCTTSHHTFLPRCLFSSLPPYPGQRPVPTAPTASATTSPVPSDCVSSSKVAVRLVLAHPDLARHILRLWRGDRRREILEPVGNVGTRRIHRRLRQRRLREQRPGALRRLAAILSLSLGLCGAAAALVSSFTSARPTDEKLGPSPSILGCKGPFGETTGLGDCFGEPPSGELTMPTSPFFAGDRLFLEGDVWPRDESPSL